MNQKEKQYIINRINDIEQEKTNEARKYFTVPAITVGAKEKLDRLRKGDFELKEFDPKINTYYWYNYVDFGEKDSFLKDDEFDAAKKAIKHESTKLKDQVMLGADNAEFLKLLQAFAEMKFV